MVTGTEIHILFNPSLSLIVNTVFHRELSFRKWLSVTFRQQYKKKNAFGQFLLQ